MGIKLTNAERKREYKRTPNGFLRTLYDRMSGRVKGNKSTRQPELYIGKEILPRDQFLEWAMRDETFMNMFTEYLNAGRSVALAPSVDRIDNKRGYTIDNIQWLTHKENCRKARSDNE
jgi:hypothetical protein